MSANSLKSVRVDRAFAKHHLAKKNAVIKQNKASAERIVREAKELILIDLTGIFVG